uniref:Protein kinase domain-containing protein n=1 Tax=Steinernema glaseri TaxID=37863 RepID=A0A1I7ZQD5_9BILA
MPCSVWMFEKKAIERWPKHERHLFLETMKQGHALVESRDSLAFCTEPVFSSLANVLGKTDNMPDKIPEEVENYELLDVDIRHGLFQLTEALAFLHFDGKMLHRNICPESVIINEKGAWKLAGFDFSIQGTIGSSGKPTFEMLEWDQRTMAVVQPALDYMAPEYVVGGRCDMYADMYSLGILSFAVFNKCRTPFSHDNNLDQFRKNADQLKQLQPNVLASLPAEFKDDVKMCLNFTPDLRPDATQFSKGVLWTEK